MKHFSLRKMALVALLMIGSAAGPPAQAGTPLDSLRIQSGARESASISQDRAVDIVRSRYSGKVLGASLRYQGSRPVYYVKILTDEGRVRTIKVDGVNGQII